MGATSDSEFQHNYIIYNLSDKSVICHDCVKTMEIKVEEKIDILKA